MDESFLLDDKNVWRAQQKDAAIMAIHKSESEEDSKSRLNETFSILQEKCIKKLQEEMDHTALITASSSPLHFLLHFFISPFCNQVEAS
jgi:hypothetical protein